tara:strand:- start:804 stop:1430 length:627 start_codon:yes stop_codon:yes gene_type:complete
MADIMDMINQAMSGVSAAARGAGSMRRGVETAMSSMPDEDDIKEFERQHGGPYDPKSRMDRGKMGSIIAARKPKKQIETESGFPEGSVGDKIVVSETDEEARRREASEEKKSGFPKGSVGDKIVVSETDEETRRREAKEQMMGPDEATLEELFKTTHGGSFDPKSRLDAKKMDQIKQLLSEGGDFGDLSDKKNRNRFALQIYRKFDYV